MTLSSIMWCLTSGSSTDFKPLPYSLIGQVNTHSYMNVIVIYKKRNGVIAKYFLTNRLYTSLFIKTLNFMKIFKCSYKTGS